MQASTVDEVDQFPDEVFEREIEGSCDVGTVPTVDLTVPGEPVRPRTPSVREIVIPWSNALKSMINEFIDSDVLQCCLIMVIKVDNGKVEIGWGACVTCEALSLFWMEFSIAASTRAPEIVPSIRHDFQKPESGRVLHES